MKISEPLALSWTLDNSLVHLLHRASQAAEDCLSRGTGSSDVTPRQLAVLTAVARTPSISQTEIVHATGIDRSTLADIVRRLVRQGYLHRNRTREDARAYAVRLTEKGGALVAEMGAHAAKAEASLLERLSPADRGRLIDLLRQLADGDHGGDLSSPGNQKLRSQHASQA